MSCLVDGTFALRVALINDEHGLVRPLAVAHKLLVGPARHKDIGEHFVTARAGAVVHSVARGEDLPITVVSGAQQLALLVVLWLRRLVVRRSSQQGETGNENQSGTKNGFHGTLRVGRFKILRTVSGRPRREPRHRLHGAGCSLHFCLSGRVVEYDPDYESY